LTTQLFFSSYVFTLRLVVVAAVVSATINRDVLNPIFVSQRNPCSTWQNADNWFSKAAPSRRLCFESAAFVR